MANIGTANNRNLSFDLSKLTRHAVVLGTTGSGKTVMGKVLIEEALQKNIPVIALDPKGDIGSLAVIDKDFDFRPFAKPKQRAEKVAAEYRDAFLEQARPDFEKLKKVKTTIFTPKSNNGIAVSLLPDLSAPKKFNLDDPNIVSDFVEPISASIIGLAGVKGAGAEKGQSLISSIIIDYWEKKKDLSIKKLVSCIISPPFEDIGSLPLDDFMKEAERKKLAASINLILSSPAKKAWQHGEKLDMQQMLSKGNLSVFDLRFCAHDEKQFVAGQLMQELYKFLVRKGGSQRLRYILYIDELAGLLPPPPASPPSKKLLELLIRQARAFGLGIIVSTQNPGDIDYRVLGNIGTRFIGRLRTAKDIEKVATAMDIVPSKLKESVSKLKIGDFVLNDAVSNRMTLMHARWLVSYHRGPLKPDEIRMVNEGDRPKEGELKIRAPKKSKPTPKLKRPQVVRTRTVIREPKIRKTDGLQYTIKQVKKHADHTQVKIKLSSSKIFTPHLKIVIEPKRILGLDLSLQGPYVFDLSSRMIPIDNYLKNLSWSEYINEDVDIARPKYSIEKTFRYSMNEARLSLRRPYYESTITYAKSVSREKVEKANLEHIMQELKFRIQRVDERANLKKQDIDDKIRRNNEQIRLLNSRLTKLKAQRMIKRVIGGRRLSKRPKEVVDKERRIKSLQRQNARLRKEKSSVTEKRFERKDSAKYKAKQKAASCIKRRIYRPYRNDMIIHATILLVPRRRSMA